MKLLLTSSADLDLDNDEQKSHDITSEINSSKFFFIIIHF